VLAAGIDNVYPPENEELHRAIAEQGLLISERAPSFSPRGKDFPRRNRLISGISLGVVVVEAAELSSLPPSSSPPQIESERQKLSPIFMLTSASWSWGALGRSPVDIDELIRATRLPARKVHIVLLELDLAGRLQRHGQRLVSLTGT